MNDALISEDDRAAIRARAEAWGVDLASLRARLAMTPTERALANEQALELVEALRSARSHASDPTPRRGPR